MANHEKPSAQKPSVALLPLEFLIFKRLQRLQKSHPNPTPVILLMQVSGGHDSMALVTALQRVLEWQGQKTHAKSLPACKLCVQHFQHGKRPEQSEQERLLVQQFCTNHDLDFFCETRDQWPEHGNFQNHARLWRKQSAVELSQRLLATWPSAQQDKAFYPPKQNPPQPVCYVVTAHHGRDHVESVLLHVLRGCGPQGLIGIKELSAWKEQPYWRPLFDVPYAQLQDYVSQKNVAFSLDSSNNASVYLRNGLRLQVLPQLYQLCPPLEKRFRQLGDMVDAWDPKQTQPNCEGRGGQQTHTASDPLAFFVTPDTSLYACGQNLRLLTHAALSRNVVYNVWHACRALRRKHPVGFVTAVYLAIGQNLVLTKHTGGRVHVGVQPP